MFIALAGAAAAQPLPVGDEDAGRDAFASTCTASHQGGPAPSLKGIIGHKIASQADFTSYSDGLKVRSGPDRPGRGDPGRVPGRAGGPRAGYAHDHGDRRPPGEGRCGRLSQAAIDRALGAGCVVRLIDWT